MSNMNITEAIDHITELAEGKPVNEEKAATFRQWLLESATEEEREMLARAHEEVLMHMKGMPLYNNNLIVNNIYSRLTAYYEAEAQATEEHNRQDLRHYRKVTAKSYWWAAAATLLLLGGGVVWLMRSTQKQPAVLAQTGILEPGGNKAVLTLANGEQLILDKEHNDITTQHEARITRTDSGTIAYAQAAGNTLYHTLSTPRGGQFRVTLPDGSAVWLNSASSLRYPTTFSGKERRVELSGEAYFEIAPDASRPFTVKADKLETHVLGTAFNIMAYADENAIRTTLINGSVKVEAGDANMILKPGVQASITPAENKFQTTTPDLGEVLAWKNGQFRFTHANIKEVMRELARWYNIKVSYEGNVDNIGFEGILSRKVTAQQLLETMEATGEVHFEITGDQVRVIPGPRK